LIKVKAVVVTIIGTTPMVASKMGDNLPMYRRKKSTAKDSTPLRDQ